MWELAFFILKLLEKMLEKVSTKALLPFSQN